MATSASSPNAVAPVDEYADFPLVKEKDEYADFPLVEKAEDADYSAFPLVSPDVVVQEAQRATMGAVQALDVMRAPQALDWSDVNEKMDAERFREAEGLMTEVRGKISTPERRAQFARANEILGQVSPYTEAGRYLAAQREGKEQAAIEIASTAERGSTPSSVLGSLMGPGLAPTVVPVAEGAARGLGGAAGGALAAAQFVPHPGTQAVARFGMPLVAAMMGSMAGTAGQEAVLQAAETPEETAARKERAADDFARNRGLSLIGGAAASLPFFGPSLAQFGRAAAGDRGAMLNLGITGTIGGATEAAMAKFVRGEEIEGEDVLAAVVANMFLNEPTRLGRRMGLTPSSEQAAVEAAEAKYGGGVPPIGRPPTSEVGTIAGMRRVPSVVPEQIAPAVETPVPAETAPVPIRSSEAPVDQVLAEKGAQEGRELPPAKEPTIPPSAPNQVRQTLDLVEDVRNSDNHYDGGACGYYARVLYEGLKSEGAQPIGVNVYDGNSSFITHVGVEYNGKILDGFGEQTPEQFAQRWQERYPDADIRLFPLKLKYDNWYLGDRAVQPAGLDRAADAGIDTSFLKGESVEGQRESNLTTSSGENAKTPAEGIPVEGEQQIGQGSAVPLASSIKAAPEPPVIPPTEPPAAPAAEAPQPLDPNVTSNKEAVVNAERAERALDPIIKEARISNPDAMARAEAIVAENPLRPQEIVARLNSEGAHERTIAFEDSAILLTERAKLNGERQELMRRATDETLPPEQRAVAQEQFTIVEEQINAMDQAAQGARSTWGRFGQLWQKVRQLDFTEDALLNRARLKKGEALTPEESTQIKAVADEHAVRQAEADAAVAKAEAAQVEKQVDATIEQVAKTPDLEPAVKSLADRIIAKLDLQAEQARKNLRELFGKQLNALGPLDPRILTNFTVLAASRIAKGAIKSGQWAAEMVKEWGEGARPYLENAWQAASGKLDEMVNAGTGDKKKRATVKKKILDAGVQQSRVTAAITERVKEGESLDALGNYIDRLVESFVRGGTRDRNALTAQVKAVLEPLSPGITDQKVHELISGYGRAKLLSKDPVKVVQRDLKGQLLQVSKLEKLAAKEPLKKTGPERRTQSDEERRLIREVNEAKKAAGVTTTDPETQLKSTMDAARTRFANQIKDLTFEIETGTRPPTRTPVQYEADIEIMRGLRDRLRQTVRDLEGPTQRTEEQRIAITRRGLNDSITALEARIAGQQPPTRRAAPDTPEIRALKAKRDALREELNEINSADALLKENRKAEALVRSIERAEAELAGATARPGAEQGPESQLVTEARAQLAAVREQIQAKRDADPLVQQERMDAAEAAVERAIKKLDEQLRAGDISVQRAPTPAASQRLEDLRLQRDAMNRLRAQLRAEARPKPNPLDVAIKARKSQLARQEADYEARIAAKDFAPRTRKPAVDITGDRDAMDALARVQAVKDKFAKLQKEWELANRTKTQKVKDAIGQAWDATRNLMLSFDLSVPLQTAFSMASRPIQGAKAMGIGMRVFAEQFLRNSDTYAKRVQQQIENSPNNKNGLYKEMKLDLSLGDKREENAASILERFADLESRWQDIPDFVKGLFGLQGKPLVKGAKGIAKALPKVLGMGIKASNAGFNAVANHMRARTADAMLARWARRRGMPSKQQLELLGNQINAATGKGGLKGETAIQKLLFAPNYYLSILKQLSLQPVRKAAEFHEGGAAMEILEEYARATATILTIGALQYLFGNRDKQTLDPRSKNFARMMTDKGTSIDFTMGRGSWVTLAAQIAPDWAGGGKSIDKKGRLVKQDRGTALLNFIKGRLSREISTAITTGAGTDFRGKPLDAAALAKEMVTPLSWRDVDKVLKREGITRGALIQMLNMVGVTHRLAE